MKKKQKDCFKNFHFVRYYLKNHTLNVLETQICCINLLCNELVIVKTSKAKSKKDM